MHKHLKDFKLRVVRAHWMLQDDLSAMLADPSLTQHERQAIERELEEDLVRRYVAWLGRPVKKRRSEEHTSELQSLMRNSYAVFCLKKKKYERHNEIRLL